MEGILGTSVGYFKRNPWVPKGKFLWEFAKGVEYLHCELSRVEMMNTRMRAKRYISFCLAHELQIIHEDIKGVS